MTPTWKSDCGRVTLYCADCLTVLPRLSGVDAFVCDPPYSSGGMVRGDRMQNTRVKYQSSDVQTEHPEFTGDNRDQRGFVAWATLWLLHAQAATMPGGVACLFSDWRQLPSMTDALQAGGWVWRGIVPWDKEQARPMPNRFRQQCEFVVWGTNGPRNFNPAGATYHPGIIRCPPPPLSERTMAVEKPVEALLPLVAIGPPGGLVCDAFMGTGSAALACIRTGRRFVGIEKDAGYFAIAKARLQRELAQPMLLPPEPPPPAEQPDLFGHEPAPEAEEDPR